MAAWSDGYFTDVQYTGHYYPELAPGFMAFACLRQGVRPPRLDANASYLELGCGQGYGLNLLAAANPHISFVGVDFHPGQIDNARRLAADAGLVNVEFQDWSFEQMLALPAQASPKFDVVALHGIWSWVSPENRACIVQILDRVMKPGAMAYVSYNCLPGWAPLIALQRFIAEHVSRGSGPVEARIVEALRAAERLAEGDAAFFKVAPYLKARIERALKEKPAYLIHEYLNAHSHPFFHADVARELEGARLSFAASANLADDLVNLAAPAPLQPMVRDAADPAWRETLLDFAGDKPFRRDIFVRGPNLLSSLERDVLLGETRFALMTQPGDATFEFAIPIGRIKGAEHVYRPIVEALAEGPRRYADIAALPAFAGGRGDALLQAMTLLVGGRQIHPLRPVAETSAATAAAFNRALVGRLQFDEIASYLAAPLVGTGVHVEFPELVAARAILYGQDDAAQAAREAWETMARTGRRLLKDGEVLSDAGANQAAMVERLSLFDAAKAPLFRRLGVL